jgi:hypothetical protein
MYFSEFPLPDPHMREMKSLKNIYESQPPAETSRSVALSGIEGFESRMGPFGQLELLHGLRRFFLNMTGIRIDIFHDKVELGKTTYDNIPEDKRHLLRRRINAFLAQLSHASVTGGVPVKIDPPEYAIDCVEAILTAFKGLTKAKKVAAYCDAIPFPTDLDLTSPSIVALREAVISCALDKFPKLAGEGRRNAGGGKRKSLLAKESDDLTYDDILVAAFLLPHVIRADMVKDFLRAEVIVTQKLAQPHADEESNGVEES